MPAPRRRRRINCRGSAQRSAIKTKAWGGLPRGARPVVDDTFFGFTFGMPVGQPNQILTIDLETGEASAAAQQDASLDPVLGATRLTKRDRKQMAAQVCTNNQ
jgi:hypothetical protein